MCRALLLFPIQTDLLLVPDFVCPHPQLVLGFRPCFASVFRRQRDDISCNPVSLEPSDLPHNEGELIAAWSMRNTNVLPLPPCHGPCCGLRRLNFISGESPPRCFLTPNWQVQVLKEVGKEIQNSPHVLKLFVGRFI